MQRKRSYWILLIFSGLIKTIIGKTQWTLTLDPSIKDVYSTLGRIKTGTARTMTHCAVEWHVTQGCVAIGYSESTKACHLHQTDLAHLKTQDLFDITEDIDYYKVTCYGDYTYLKQFDICIKLYDDRKTWLNARGTCEAEGTRMLVVETRELLDFLQDFIVYYTLQNYWLGAVRESSGDWYWQTGEIINASTGGQLWLPGRPQADGDCMMMQHREASGEFGLRDRECSNRQRFFCQKV